MDVPAFAHDVVLPFFQRFVEAIPAVYLRNDFPIFERMTALMKTCDYLLAEKIVVPSQLT